MGDYAVYVVCGVFLVSTGWVMWEVLGLRPIVFAKHARLEWRRPAAAMGTWQVCVGAVLACFRAPEGVGAAVSGSMANVMLGTLFLLYAALTPRWRRMWGEVE